jgi:hypothetical protein
MRWAELLLAGGQLSTYIASRSTKQNLIRHPEWSPAKRAFSSAREPTRGILRFAGSTFGSLGRREKAQEVPRKKKGRISAPFNTALNP